MTPPGEGNGADGADEDPSLGPPVAELREVSLPLGDRFVGRVRGRDAAVVYHERWSQRACRCRTVHGQIAAACSCCY